MSPDFEPIYNLIRDVHTEQLNSTASLARIEQALKTTTNEVAEMKVLVDKHEQAYALGKFLGIPAYIAAHLGVKGILSKLGW